MPNPPPRKVKPTALLKTLHSDQSAKLQAKHQLECDLLEDIRTFARQRSIIEKEYGQALQKLTSQLLKRDFQAMPDLPSCDGQEHKTVMAVWRIILEETDQLAKKRLQAAEVYLEKIAEPIKPLKTNKQQIYLKKVAPQLTQIQAEVSHTVAEMNKFQKAYNVDETQAYEARAKATDAEDKLSKKNKGIFQSLSSLQKNHAKLKARIELCEAKSTESRNDYLLCMAAANAHQIRYFNVDLTNIMEILDGEMFERIQEYFAIYGNTAQEISCLENRSFNKFVELTSMINRNFDLKCFLYTNRVFTDLVQYEFEPCLQDKCIQISRDFNAAHHLDKEARKWMSRIAKETKVIQEFQKAIKALGTGEKIIEPGSSEAVPQDPEVKLEEYQEHIRQAETAKAKAEARIEALRKAGVNVDEWLSGPNVESLEGESDLKRTSSHTSIKTDSSGQTEDHDGPTYTHFDEDDDFTDDKFDVSVQEVSPKITSNQYPMKCRAIYEFHAGNADELDMAENEELEIVGDSDGDGWLKVCGRELTMTPLIKAKNSKGQFGVIPENYIVLLGNGNAQQGDLVDSGSVNAQFISMDGAAVSFPSPEMDPNTPLAVTSENDDQFEFPPPPLMPAALMDDVADEVTPYSTNDIEVQQTTNFIGSMQLPLGGGVWVRALYDYEGTNEDELTFQEGTLIKILRKDQNGIDDGFWEGELNGRVGVFPSLVVEELSDLDLLSQVHPATLQSPQNYMHPPPVTITAATPDAESPPPSVISSIANGKVPVKTNVPEQVQQLSIYKKVRFGVRNYCTTNTFYSHPAKVMNNYDSMFDDSGEESLV